MCADVALSPQQPTKSRKYNWETFLGKKRSKDLKGSESPHSSSSSNSPHTIRKHEKEPRRIIKNLSVEEKGKKERGKKKKKKRNSGSDEERNETPGQSITISPSEPEQIKVIEEDNQHLFALNSSSTDITESESDSDGENFIGDFEFTDDHPEKPFVCLKETDLVLEQNKEIQRISELLMVTYSQASGLLRYFRWNKDKLLTKFFEDPEGVLEAAGVKVKSNQSSPSEFGIILTENRCSICDQEAGVVELYSLECKHDFCCTCWDQYLTMNIQEGQSASILCPSFDCGLLVNEDFVKQIVVKEMYQKYLSFLAKSFVESNSQVFIYL
jgi:hypothetical protein